jgi:glycosyltransferase involved in cell wall biosynthesis
MRMAKLAKYLPKTGWDVVVICSAEAAVNVLDPDLLRQIPPAVVVNRVRGPFATATVRAKAYAKSSSEDTSRLRRASVGLIRSTARAVMIPDRWIGWAHRVARLRIDDVGDPDVILSSGPPHSAHLAGLWLARRLRIPLVMDIRDDWADNPVHSTLAPWRRTLEGCLERQCLEQAAAVVHVSEQHRQNLERRYPRLTARLHVIPNGYDPEDFGNVPPRRPAQQGETVRFLYAGSLRGNQETGRLFEVFGRMASEGHPILLEMLGAFDTHFRRAAMAGIDSARLRIHDSVPHADAIRAMADAHVLVLFTGPAKSGTDTTTGKLYEYLALRRPILLIGPPGQAADLIATLGAGVVAGPTDVLGIERAIEQAVRLGSNISLGVTGDSDIRRFDRVKLAEDWSDLLSRVLGGDRQLQPDLRSVSPGG